MMKRTNMMAWLAAAVVILSAGGCKSTATSKSTDRHIEEKHETDIFKQDLSGQRVTRFIDIQSANGARHDAMLYPAHFDGAKLNSLGQSKVLLMLEDAESSEPVTVHLVNCGEGDLLAQRKSTVEAYLQTAVGPNPLTFHPAAPELIRFNKTESGKIGSSSQSNSSQSVSASSAGTSSDMNSQPSGQ